MSTLLIQNIKTLCGITENNQLKKGFEMAKVNSISNAYLFVENGIISSFGEMINCPTRADECIDATDRFVMPGWCDSHTHLVFAASREDEFVHRIKGMSYAEIAEKGGGILNSSRKLQAMSEHELYELAASRLENLISNGTVAIEIKSGYGLSSSSELKMLRVIRRLKENYSISIKPTFLGAHAVPLEFKNNRQAYIDLIINEMLPQIADEGLAVYCDVFCDEGFFTVAETDEILKAGIRHGLRPKLHANELANSGGVQIGVANNAISVDHLEEIGATEIEVLLQSTTIPTVLPSCSYFLKIPYAPARRMIDAGLGIAIASDYNPGTSPSGNMALLQSIACTQMKLLPEEAFNGTTINGANAMEIENEYGSIAIGKVASLIITKPMNALAYLPYAFGVNHIDKVIVKGKLW